MSLKQSEKEGQISRLIYDQIPTIRWKFGENRSGGSWNNL